MSYIGKEPAQAFTSFAKQDFTTSATTSYTLDHPVANGNEIALFINFVRQEPTAAYTASGTSLTLTSATTSSDDMYCVYLGKAVQTVNPPNSSVGSSQVSADLITGQTALGATPADTDELLISDAGTLKRIDVSLVGGKNTPAFQAIKTGSSNQTISGSATKITFDSESFDTDSCFASNKFTPNVAGKYYFTFHVLGQSATENLEDAYLRLHKNGSAIGQHAGMDSQFANVDQFQVQQENALMGSFIDTANGSSDYYEIFAYYSESFTVQYASFSAYKLIGV